MTLFAQGSTDAVTGVTEAKLAEKTVVQLYGIPVYLEAGTVIQSNLHNLTLVEEQFAKQTQQEPSK